MNPTLSERKANKIPTDRKRIQEGNQINSPQRKRNKACGTVLDKRLRMLGWLAVFQKSKKQEE